MQAGLRLIDRYRLVECLGDGDAKEVWRARDELLDRTVIVKVLDPTIPGVREGVRRWISKAAGLTHPAIATIYDCDQTRDSDGRLTPYVVTEFVEGEDLATRLRRSPLGSDEGLEACARIAEALAAAHANGLPHGDLRMDRIILGPGGAKVVDFGIGMIVRGGADPETAEAADVYALGGILDACLPDDVDRLQARCRASDAVSRPSADVAADSLGRAARARLDTVIVSAPRPVPEPERRSGRNLGAAVGVLVIAAGVVGALLIAHRPGPVAHAPGGGVASSQAGPRYSAPAEPTVVPTGEPTVAPTGGAESVKTLELLAQLRPIVERGFTLGKVRSDVAVDLDNVINNLRNDLITGRPTDVAERLAQLQEKIATRLREQGLTQDVAARLTDVLSTGSA
ncbi:protein kinase [Actinomadura barringtoniae]|uniref:non-specific serine/threonine protein kinase n=1 Tax=Actinomadura barringtoniae TaxID=1427535 RepID=A0A939PDM8_9ACTN|nr:protein kinase [Actinomadura barringtoniae]MBO2450912.1 protein kinase [Actinomadura barringtoniae]